LKCFIKFVSNDKPLLTSFPILSELRKSNTQKIVNFRVPYSAQKGYKLFEIFMSF